MKAGLFSVACVGLLQLAAAQPHQAIRQRHAHRHHAKRQDVVVTTVGSVVYDIEDVVVYVDPNNQPVSTSTIWRHQDAKAQVPTSTPSPSPSTPPPPPPPAPVAPAPKVNEKLAVAPQPAASSSPPPASSSSPAAPISPPSSGGSGGSGGSASSGPGFGSAITYTPYKANSDCKSAEEVATDLQAQSGYEVIRLYGSDCNQVANVIAATKGNVKLFLGIFHIDAIASEVQTIASAVNGNWGLVNTVSVGNELVDRKLASVEQVTAAIATARAALKSAGYNGPVVTVDTMVAMRANPALCTASDFCAINCHAFFDGNVLPADAGKFVKDFVNQVSVAAGGKTVVVTESGWPSFAKTNNNLAYATLDNQQTAMASLKSALPTNLIQFGMYNEYWKTKQCPDKFGSEAYWGIYGDAKSG